ncbi:MAG: hypothetical protein GWO02_03500, partial [Gammaproteobacteria bacterium]|nr:hypothetical protein [Gammaproteobacteria bacterium]
MADVVRGGLFACAAGLAPGLVTGAWLSGILESRLYGVSHLDGGIYATGTAALLIVGLAASWLP